MASLWRAVKGVGGALLFVGSCLCAGSVVALVVELKDEAAVRAGKEQALPAPATPAPSGVASEREARLAAKGFALGSPVFIRIFKSESQLELWMQKEGRFELFSTYPICYWSGTLGPKVSEGDRQAPEGLYFVGPEQLHRTGRWPRSLDLGFPNAVDRASARTGSNILVHGGCTSVGCFAMTNPGSDEIFALSEAALRNGQPAIQVHVFPFRMSEENLAAYTKGEWYAFWLNLKPAYDAFERTRLPPRISVCGRRYVVSETQQLNGEEWRGMRLGARIDPPIAEDCDPEEIAAAAQAEALAHAKWLQIVSRRARLARASRARRVAQRLAARRVAQRLAAKRNGRAYRGRYASSRVRYAARNGHSRRR
jgi:murein L,D-transpeptidase YafK